MPIHDDNADVDEDPEREQERMNNRRIRETLSSLLEVYLTIGGAIAGFMNAIYK